MKLGEYTVPQAAASPDHTMRLADACELLAIGTGTSREDAQKAYRKLALRHHPDRCPNDPTATSRFQTVGEALC